jgi:hypothetical protein
LWHLARTCPVSSQFLILETGQRSVWKGDSMSEYMHCKNITFIFVCWQHR